MKKAKKLGLSLLLSACLLAGGLSLGQPSMVVAEDTAGETAVNETIKAQCQAAVDLIDLNVDEDGIVSDMLLPATSLYSTTFSWVSSNPAVLTINAIVNENDVATGYRGTVTRGDADVKVDLTVTAQKGDDTVSVAKRVFNLTILKKSEGSGTVSTLEIEEDFTSYEPGVDLSNYSLWSQTSGDAQISAVIDEPDFPNNMVTTGGRALKITSARQAANVRYDRTINIPRAEQNRNVLSGYYLFSGETNSVSIEIVSDSTVLAGISFSHEGVSQRVGGQYQTMSTDLPKEIVWLRFRLCFFLSGYSYIELWDWKTNSYTILGQNEAGFTVNSGVNMGFATGGSVERDGGANKLRIGVDKGTSVGASYLANLKISNLTTTPSETSIENPNREEGISIIDGYKETILAFKGETPEGIDPSAFTVHNRFNDETAYVEDVDYTIETTMDPASGDADVVTYTHTFTLTSTGETKVVTQNVYFDEKTNPAKFASYHVSYLKKAEGETTGNPAYMTISGEVIRNDITLYYMVLEKDSAAPTAAQVEGNATTVTGYALGGSYAIAEHDWSFDTEAKLDLAKEYDVYLLGKNDNGSTEVLKVAAISTVVNISTCEEFFDMTTNLNTIDSEFRLLNDLDFSNYDWKFVQANSVKFGGILDGQGHTISNLTITSTEAKVGLFTRVEGGTVKNLTFKDCETYGLADVGIVAGETYEGTFSNLRFEGCTVGIEETMSGGDGYFGILTGRCRGDGKVVDMDNIVISDGYISCPKYCGLLTGGLEKGVTTTIDNIEAEGAIYTDGAAVGLIGRNRGATTINNGICFLEIEEAKKEVAIVAGHNKEGGSLTVKNFFGDLKINSLTQPNYFGQLIGSHDSNTSKYEIENFGYVNEDYSDLSDSITPDTKTVTPGQGITRPSSIEAWEQNTFIRDFNTNLVWAYDENSRMPYLSPRSEGDLELTASLFSAYVAELSDEPAENHYYLYKARNVYTGLSAEELAKVPSADKEKYEKALAAYEALQKEIEDATGGFGYRG